MDMKEQAQHLSSSLRLYTAIKRQNKVLDSKVYTLFTVPTFLSAQYGHR